MGMLLGPETEYAKEMRKWESYPSQWGPGGRPYQFREFPKRLYKAARVDGKGIQITEALTARDTTEEANLLSRGFHFGQPAAIEAIEREHTEHGKLAAEREWQIRHGRLSERATAEAREAEAAHGAKHLPDVPETPRRRGRRPSKTALVTAEV